MVDSTTDMGWFLLQVTTGFAGRIGFALVVLAATALSVAPAAEEIGVPYFINFDPKSYDPTIGYQNWAAVEDDRGVIYLGNTSGVVEFDGVSWRLIPLPGRSTARSLAVDDSGRIYVGGQGTFGYLEADSGGQLRYRVLSQALREEERDFADVWKTHATSDGIYFQTFDAVFRWHGGVLSVIRPQSQFHMSFEVNGTLFIRQEGIGLMTIRGDTLTPMPGGEVFAAARIYAMVPMRDGDILIGTREQGLFVLHAGRFQAFPSEADELLSRGQLYHGTALADGSVALATLRSGVVIIDELGHNRMVLDRALGLQDSTVTSVTTDRRGGLWLTLDRNVTRVQIPASFTLFGEVTGLIGGVTAVERFHGGLYVATTQGVYRLLPEAGHDGRTTVSGFKPVTGIATQSWDLCISDGQLIAATNDGVFHIDGNRAERIATVQALTLLSSHYEPHTLFVGALDGVYRVDRRPAASEPTQRVETVDDEIRSLVEDDSGALWAGGRYRGLHRLRRNPASSSGWLSQAYGEQTGLPVDHLRTQVFAAAGDVFAATSSGLYRYRFDSDDFTAATGLGAPFGNVTCWITSLREGNGGDIWIVSGPDTGVGVSKRDADGRRRWHNTAFRSIPPSTVLEIFSEPSGTVWLGTSNGLIRHDPSVPQAAPRRLRCLIRQVTTLEDEHPVFRGTSEGADTLRRELPYNRNDLRFEFAAPLPEAQAGVEYRHRLEGFDRAWSDWSREVRREYTNLPEGSYDFRVMARAAGGVISDTASFPLHILPPWFRTWWATSLFILAAAVALWAFVEMQVRHARRSERVESDNRRRAHELQRARKIQHNMLPSSPPEIPALDIVAEQRTATEVGGDYYDFFPQEDGTLYVAIGDATGHGLGAGLMVAATRTALLTVRESDLVKVVNKLNQVLRSVHLGNRLNMALTLVGLKLDGGPEITVEASGGGMVPMYVLRANGAAEEHSVCGIPLGAFADPEYALTEFRLRSGDALILMSDGVHERRHPDGGPLGFDGVLRCLGELGRTRADGHELPAAAILQYILDHGDRWARHAPIEDDVTVVVIKLR